MYIERGPTCFDKMEFWKLVLYFAICTFSTIYICAEANTDAEYYWRDFDGTIPLDAVPGGKDKLGSITYIGQTFHTNGELMVGEIVPSQRMIYYFFWDKGFSAVNNIKILCTVHPEQFEWIKTNVVSLRFLANKHLVIGGNATNYPLLVGRVSLDDQIIVGKVSVSKENEGFAYATVGEAHYQRDSYEVLSYNPRCSKKKF